MLPSGPITKAEIRSAIISMKAGKASGIDCMTVELLKADITTTVNVFTTSSVRYGSVRLSSQIGGRVSLSRLPKNGISPSVETGGGLL